MFKFTLFFSYDHHVCLVFGSKIVLMFCLDPDPHSFFKALSGSAFIFNAVSGSALT
jgi:hypothetical protein